MREPELELLAGQDGAGGDIEDVLTLLVGDNILHAVEFGRAHEHHPVAHLLICALHQVAAFAAIVQLKRASNKHTVSTCTISKKSMNAWNLFSLSVIPKYFSFEEPGLNMEMSWI